MVRQCQVCGKFDSINPELSFHRFPVDHERRNVWFSLVGINENQRLPKHPEICSSHFHPSDIIMKQNGLWYVKPGANPEPIDSVFSQSTVYSSDSTTYDTPPRKSKNQNISLKDLVATPGSSASSDGVPLKEMEAQSEEERQSSSSVTATASEAENEMRKLLNINPSEVSKELPKKAVSKKRKRRYIGDLASSEFSTPEKRSKNLARVKTTVLRQRKRIHSLQMTVRRLRVRITSLQSLLNHLKEKSLISESSESTIRASLSGPAVDIFERLLKAPSVQKYNPSLRSFALTLSFYSAKAYSFVRNTFNRTLPHIGTISKWYRSVDGSPGFTKEALVALTLKQQDSSRPFLCNLVMDEMSIRRQVEWTGQKFTGYVDIGTNIDEDTLPEAREVLLFMIVALNGSWKVPIGYFY